MSRLQGFSLGLRAIMELSIVLAFAYWGYQTGTSTATKILLGIGAPVVGFGFGAYRFSSSGAVVRTPAAD